MKAFTIVKGFWKSSNVMQRKNKFPCADSPERLATDLMILLKRSITFVQKTVSPSRQQQWVSGWRKKNKAFLQFFSVQSSIFMIPKNIENVNFSHYETQKESVLYEACRANFQWLLPKIGWFFIGKTSCSWLRFYRKILIEVTICSWGKFRSKSPVFDKDPMLLKHVLWKENCFR